MRVLLVHNRYSSQVPSGENGVVDDEARWLADAGVHVDRFEANNDDVKNGGLGQRLITGVNAAWSLPAAARFRASLRETRPDVVHVHNLFPLLTGSVVGAARRAGVPVVWTVHNYRLNCVAGTHYRDGARCDECQRGIPWAAGVRYGCYDESRISSAALTAATAPFRFSARRHVFAAPVSRFVGDWLTRTGFDPDRVRVKYGAVAETNVATTPPSHSRRYVFVGRLGPEKGAVELASAFHRLDAPSAKLVVIGNGKVEEELRARAADDPRLKVLGLLPRTEVLAEVAQARAVVVPSLWDEPFPRTAVEALSLGRPIITTGMGGLRETVDASNGWLTAPSVDGLASALDASWALGNAEIDALGASSRRKYEASFTPEKTTSELIDIYRAAIESARNGAA